MSEYAKHQINVRMLKQWLADLPDDMDDAVVESCVGSQPFALKRIIAYRGKKDGWRGVVLNPMATHLSDEFYNDNERIATLSPP